MYDVAVSEDIESLFSESALASDTSTLMAEEAVFGALAGIASFFAILVIIFGLITIIANWKLFSKANEKGWKSIIPIYNTITLLKIAGLSPMFIFIYFASIIPYIGFFITFGFTIYFMYKLAKAFGKGEGFTVGLVLLNLIFILILAFGKSEYQLNKTSEQEVNV